jgi:hypothetical protein
VFTSRHPEPTEANILAVFIAAGADPQRLAQWMQQNTETPLPVDALAHVGDALRAERISGVRQAEAELSAQ